MRRPPRGVPKSDQAKRNFYDVWLPNLAPSEVLLESAQAALSDDDGRSWKTFARKYRAEMKTPDNRALLATLAALSRHTNFSVGYCADEARCHRSLLRALLVEHGGEVQRDRSYGLVVKSLKKADRTALEVRHGCSAIYR